MARERQGTMQTTGVCFVAAEPKIDQIRGGQYVLSVFVKWSSLGNPDGSAFTVKMFSDRPPAVANYISKGKMIGVTGHLRIRRWKYDTTGPNGETLWGCEPQLVVDRNGIELLDNAQAPSGQGGGGGQQYTGPQQQQDDSQGPVSGPPQGVPGPSPVPAAPTAPRMPADLPPLSDLV